MKQKDKNSDNTPLNETETHPVKKHELPQSMIIPLMVVYLGTSILLPKAGQAKGIIQVFGEVVPISVFTGVLSSIGNICVIFMVVFFKKLGFISALALIVIQFPIMTINFLVQHNPSSFPGFFSNLVTLIAIILIYQKNKRIEKYQETELANLKSQQKFSQRLFEQTATSLVNAIDAKDTYSHGHSLRVAEYSEKIARMLGKDDKECYKIYYTALLHDVGKIGISNSIINKKGRLTNDEYETIKQHPVMGNQILTSISEYPYLSIGARYHHERYDGHGYPDHLKGDDIPEIARIISVADAYDAMSSNRSYRDAIPQQLVREEIVKGAGTQFDPEFARVMQKLIDQDVQYKMRERIKNSEITGRKDIVSGEYRSEISDGILITPLTCHIQLKVEKENSNSSKLGRAALILFDSLDSRVHDDEKAIRDMYYLEYCEIWLDGEASCHGARKLKTEITELDQKDKTAQSPDGSVIYNIEVVKRRDHALVKINDGQKLITVIVALPDSSRYVYTGITGEHCSIVDISVKWDKHWISDDYIPRIAEKITYIDKPEGDIPNVQVDGHRTSATNGLLLQDQLQFSFHTMSLPSARLIWHCPYLAVFSSSDGKFNGKDYKEYAVIRLDGEVIENDDSIAENLLTVTKSADFKGWDFWKEKNKQGFDSTVSFRLEGNTVTTITENLGISVKNITKILDKEKKIYVALTGDQCALTGIRIK